MQGLGLRYAIRDAPQDPVPQARFARGAKFDSAVAPLRVTQKTMPLLALCYIPPCHSERSRTFTAVSAVKAPSTRGGISADTMLGSCITGRPCAAPYGFGGMRCRFLGGRQTAAYEAAEEGTAYIASP